MTTQAERGRLVRGKLLDAAAELIAERGWGGVSTRILAERAGVAPGLVHYHFGSVTAVLIAAAERAVGGSVDELTSTLTQLSPGDGVVMILGWLDSLPDDDPSIVLATEAYLASAREPALREFIQAQLDAFREALTVSLEGYGHADARAIAHTLAALIDGILLHRAIGSSSPPPDLTVTVLKLIERSQP
jgi:AcrR family transcriptional regulator